MSQKHEVRIESRVLRELRSIPAREYKRVVAAMTALQENPRPSNAVRLVGQPGWRVRVGDYRVLYEVDDAARVVTVYRAGHRSKVYRQRN